MEIKYRAVIDLLPVMEDADELTEFRERVGLWNEPRLGTMAYSVDDAFSLVSNAREDSYIRVWNANFFSVGDRERLANTPLTIRHQHLPGFTPNIQILSSSLPTHPTLNYGLRSLDEVYYITIHHTVGWAYQSTLEQNAINIAHSHINGKGWPGIGYHILIGPNGDIALTNDLVTKSFHCGSWDAPGDENRVAIGVSLGGNFVNHRPPDPQWQAASAVVAWLLSFLPNSVVVQPHKRMPGAATQCPGEEELEQWLRAVSGQDVWI